MLSEKTDNFLKLIVSDANNYRTNVRFINGEFGCGKSYFVNQVEEFLSKNNIADAIIKLNIKHQPFFLTEFFTSLEIKYLKEAESTDYVEKSNELFKETNYNNLRFYEILEFIKSNDPLLAEKIYNNLFISNLQWFNENFKKEIEETISSYLSQKGDIRLITNHIEVVRESFIVDLMNIFYSNLLSLDNTNIQPKKVFILLDEFDFVYKDIIKVLLNSFIKFFSNASFQDFIAFKINLPKDFDKISNFLSFNYVISSRYDSKSLIYNLVPSSEEKYDIFYFEPLTKEELKQYIEKSNPALLSNIDDIYEITLGIPALVSEYIENYIKIPKNELQKSIINFAFNEITKLLNEDEILVLKNVSHLVSINKTSLTLLNLDETNIKNILEFASYRNDIFEKENIENKKRFKIKPIIKEITQKYLELFEPELNEELKKKYDVYNQLDPLLAKFTTTEQEVLRNLAYFVRFDINITNTEFQTFLSSETNNLSPTTLSFFIDKNSDLFLKNNYTFSLVPDLQKKLDALNKIIDGDMYTEKEKKSNKIWANIQNELGNKIYQIEREISYLDEELMSSSKKIKLLENNKTQVLGKLRQAEERLIHLKSYLEKFSIKKNLINFISFFLLSAIIFGINFYFNNFKLFKPENQVLNYIFYTLTFGTGFYSLFNLFSLLAILAKKKEKQRIYEKIEDVKKEKERIEEEIENLNNEIMDLTSKRENLNNKVTKQHQELRIVKERLAEPFVQVII